ncbi:MAG: diaminopimelate epimerase [Bacteroidales bacterium]
MKQIFSKYHGAGNDFIMVYDPEKTFQPDEKTIEQLCHRHLGIGADGLIILTSSTDWDFRMIYYNSDGREGTMCGNGGRCAVAFAHQLGVIGSHTTFDAIDGIHQGRYIKGNSSENLTSVRLKDVAVPEIHHEADSFLADTGSPHLILFHDEPDQLDLFSEGRRLRNAPEYAPGGVNVNFVKIRKDGITVRTYERGVENLTLSCGTGSTAAALAVAIKKKKKQGRIKIDTWGGKLEVAYRLDNDVFRDIWLTGPATHVFDGTIELEP